MAARSGSGTGMAVAVAILGVFTLGLFITTVIFISKTNATRREYATLQQEVRDYIRDDERQNDRITQIRAAAAAEGKSVVGYLNDSIKTAMRITTGAESGTIADLSRRVSSIQGADAGGLLAVLRDRDLQIANLQKRAQDAEDARNRAQADLQNSVKRVAELEEAQRRALQAINDDVTVTMDEVDKYREDFNQAKAAMEQRVQRIEEQARIREAELTGQIRELQQQAAIATDTIKKLQEQLRGKSFKPGDEFALVDGEVIGVDTASGQYFLSLGAKDRVTLGMTFEVYPDAGTIRPDEVTGEYPAGKATLEIIRVEEASSVARVVREKRGNPIVRGDVVANPIYDPKKVYKFLIYGNFDANRDGVYTPQEQAEIEAMIRAWGGQVVDSLSGDIDFLVLGSKPVLPPAPPSTAPVAVVDEYVRLRRVVQEYDRLFEQAQATAIPVLNENRLRTLLGGR